MRVAWKTLTLVAAFASGVSSAWAQVPLTLSEALSRARERAPEIVSARLAIDEARARLAGATHRQLNPEVDFAAGDRQGNGERSTDLDVGFSQSFEPGQRRSSRQAMANASIAQSTASLEDVTRATLLETATLFLRSLQLSERVRLLRDPWSWRTTSCKSPIGASARVISPFSTSTSPELQPPGSSGGAGCPGRTGDHDW